MGGGSLATPAGNSGNGGDNGGPSATPAALRMGATAGIRKVVNVVDDKMLIFDPPTHCMSNNNARAVGRVREHRFVFDRLFDETAAQEDVYSNTTRPLLGSVLDGYNATVFAYGATGCGKTHTISGNPQAPGIIFLTMKELFDRISDLKDTRTIDVSLSYLEIYNETIKDLLEPSDKRLTLREDSDHRIIVSNLSTHKPENVEAVMDMILHGNKNRTVSPTEANETSSRSHAVLQINVVQKNRTASLTEAHTFATLSIIDLAGSERASATKNRGDRLIEGANINKSLLALGNCINALCDPRRRNHVPYRDSKLTRLLKFSLGGNCKTVMIVCISPSSRHYDETLNTLKYADRAKKIKTKVIRNEHNLNRHVGSYLKMITEQKAEIEELRKRESRAVSQALSQAKRVNDRALESLSEAIRSLEIAYEKSIISLEQQAKIQHQLRNVVNQIDQMKILLNSFNKSPCEDNPAFSVFVEGMNQLIDKLKKEQVFRETYTPPVNPDKQMLEATITTLTRRLENTPGWKDNIRESFEVHAEVVRLRYDQELANAVQSYPLSQDLLRKVSSALFNVISRIGTLSSVGLNEIEHELSIVTEEMVTQCQGLIEQYTSGSATGSSGTDSYTAPTRTRKRSASMISITTPEKKRPEVATTSSMTRRMSTLGVAGNATRRMSIRKSPSKKHMVPKSPLRSYKRAVKRVRWEDDSENLIESPVTPLKPINLDSDTLPTPPELGLGESIDGNGLRTPPIRRMRQSFPLPAISSTPIQTVVSPGNRRSSLRFGVKGELRRKSGSRQSLVPLGGGASGSTHMKFTSQLPISNEAARRSSGSGLPPMPLSSPVNPGDNAARDATSVYQKSFGLGMPSRFTKRE